MLIRVADVVGNIAITAQDGDVIHARVLGALNAGETVELDFEGVSFFASPFFNASVGKLLERFGVQDVRAKVVPRALPADAQEIMSRVVKNAVDYYASEKTRTLLSDPQDAL